MIKLNFVNSNIGQAWELEKNLEKLEEHSSA